MKHLSKISKALMGVGCSLLFVFAFTGRPAAQACIEPPLGLVAWWPGDGDAKDIVDGNDGALLNGTTFSPGKVGQAFSLDGVDDVVRVVDTGGGQNLDGFSALTLDAWIQPNTPGGAIVSKYDSRLTNGISYYLNLAGEKLRMAIFDKVRPVVVAAEFTSNDPVVPVGVLTHVAGVWKGGFTASDFELYVNGQQVGGVLSILGTTPTAMANNAVPVNIGRFESASGTFVGPFGHFDGIIDETEIFNRALTASEILAIFNADSAGKCKFAEVPIDMDIKPGSFPNSINLKSRGVVPVAILTTPEFDVKDVALDPVGLDSISFAGASPVGSPKSEDVDGDGDLDLVFHFKTQDLDLTPDSTTATLTGTTVITVPFKGTDSVRIVPRKGRK